SQVVNYQLSTIHYQLLFSVISSQVSALIHFPKAGALGFPGGQLSTIHYPLSTINYPLSTINSCSQLSVFSYLHSSAFPYLYLLVSQIINYPLSTINCCFQLSVVRYRHSSTFPKLVLCVSQVVNYQLSTIHYQLSDHTNA